MSPGSTGCTRGILPAPTRGVPGGSGEGTAAGCHLVHPARPMGAARSRRHQAGVSAPRHPESGRAEPARGLRPSPAHPCPTAVKDPNTGPASASVGSLSSGRAFPSLQTPSPSGPPAWRWRRWKWEDGDEVEGEGGQLGCGCSQGGQGRGTQPNQAAATEGTEQSRAGSLRAVRVRQAFQESLGGPEGKNREITAWKWHPGSLG